MLLHLRKYYRPRSVEAAIRLLSANPGRCRILSGGTYLLAQPQNDLEEVVDISDLRLKSIKQDEKFIHLGAAVSLQSIIDYPRLKKFAGGILGSACRCSSVSKMIRNQRTLGGELVSASQGDLAAVLSILDARVKLVSYSMEEREMGLAEFWALRSKARGKKDSAGIMPGLALEILVPRLQMNFVAAYERVAQIESQPSLISAAVFLQLGEDRVCETARAVLGSCSDAVVRLTQLEKKLTGKGFTPELADEAVETGMDDFRPRDDSNASAAYRKAVAPALVRRALERCLKGK
jgi:CO/xanthine dehydrogenase FAD-binding subunit